MEHCERCKHLEQNHQNDGWCLYCSLIVNGDADNKLEGYCGKNNLKYLEWCYNKKRKGEINV
jgi:hypothetical protein